MSVGAGIPSDSEPNWLELGAGIGVTMTPTQLAAAYATLVNGGVAIEPSPDGSGQRRRALTEPTSRLVTDMLEAAVSEGTGRLAQVAGQRVGGKTGSTNGGVVFAGVVPVDAPRYVIVIRADVAEGWGGSVAAPVFARVVAQLLE